MPQVITETTTTIKLDEAARNHTLTAGKTWSLVVDGVTVDTDTVPTDKVDVLRFDLIGSRTDA